jgi:hypothetical protein
MGVIELVQYAVRRFQRHRSSSNVFLLNPLFAFLQVPQSGRADCALPTLTFHPRANNFIFVGVAHCFLVAFGRPWRCIQLRPVHL